ncbi:MAG: HEPN domain-containing protein [bacterium]
MGSEGEKRSVGREQQSRFPIDPLRHGVFPQAAEKVLKGVLAARRVPPPRTHDLLMLLELILPLIPTAEGLRDCLVILTPYSVATRYPDDDILSALIRTPCLSDLRGKSFFLRMYSQIAHDLDRLPGDMPF